MDIEEPWIAVACVRIGSFADQSGVEDALTRLADGSGVGDDVSDEGGERHVREADGEPAEDEDSYDLQCQAEEDGMDAQAGAQVFGGEDAGEEAREGDEVRDDSPSCDR